MSEQIQTDPIDDEYSINLALTVFRDAINDGDVSAAMETVGDAFTWMRDSEPSFWGREGRQAIQEWIRRMISRSAQVTITPINTRLMGNSALTTGWETITFGAEKAGDPQPIASRFFLTWQKSPDGQWRMYSFICNKDVPPAMLQSQS